MVLLNEKSMRFHVEINFNNIFPDNRNYNVLINNYNSVSYVPGWVLGVQLEINAPHGKLVRSLASEI